MNKLDKTQEGQTLLDDGNNYTPLEDRSEESLNLFFTKAHLNSTAKTISNPRMRWIPFFITSSVMMNSRQNFCRPTMGQSLSTKSLILYVNLWMYEWSTGGHITQRVKVRLKTSTKGSRKNLVNCSLPKTSRWTSQAMAISFTPCS